jgi:hypothetical protein
MIADFSPVSGGVSARAAQALYWGTSVVFWRLQRLSAIHRAYDYADFLAGTGFAIESVRQFRLLSPFSAPSFCTWIARREPRAQDDTHHERG